MEDASTLLEARRPASLRFAADYPAQFSMEVMDLLAGARKDDAPGFSSFFVIEKASGEVVGEIGYSCPRSAGVADAGYGLVESVWNRGYATEAMTGLISHLFAAGDIYRVEANTLKDHIASRRVMEKAGMTYEREGVDDVDGEQMLLVYYAIERPKPG